MAVEAVSGDPELVAMARITVENTSDVAGMETVQLYIHDVSAQLVRPVMELRGFRKIHLEAGARQVVEFDITRRCSTITAPTIGSFLSPVPSTL